MWSSLGDYNLHAFKASLLAKPLTNKPQTRGGVLVPVCMEGAGRGGEGKLRGLIILCYNQLTLKQDMGTIITKGIYSNNYSKEQKDMFKVLIVI